MVKIVHMADTHLGYRTKRGTINRWAQLNYSRPYEQEIYDTFLKVMENVSKIDNLNFFIHCGDIFHIPQKNNPFPPPEPARRVLKQGFDLFFNNTKNEVPLIYIEGNHGVFQGYDYTPFESHFNFNEYPNLHYFKERDLLDALKSNSSLMLEFNQQKVRFYLFPFFDFDSFEVYSSAYDSWIENQCPKKNDGFINIAVAHGSKIDKTLHKKILSDEFDYDYVALGHEHILKKETKNSFYAGSLLPLNFKEINQNQGYLIINIDEKTRKLDVEKIFTHKLLNRPFEKIQINVIPNDSSIDLNNKIQDVLKNFTSKKGFNAKTSARLKLEFIGEITYVLHI
ncbi:MAG: exonuclease SbcCD subunit D, partial [Candidatus Hermodarchaeota archaeon]